METEAARWGKIKEILDQALDLPAAKRAAYLDETCPDEGWRAEIEDYLALEDDIEDFIEEPVADLLAEQAAEGREGQEVGPYRLVRPIGHGGMGRVYLAVRADEAYQHEVAVKILKRGLDTDEIVARFRRERQILANLEHPNIARIIDGGSTADGLPYFVMEHVEGTPIHHYCQAHHLSIDERLRIFRRVCETVHVAHQNLIVHCDLKPSNILVDADGKPKLLDFGIAKLLRPDGSDTTLTRLGGRLGTPRYASPEQTVGGSITTASDVYSLGVVLYELLAGEPPGLASEAPTPGTMGPGASPYATQPVPARPAMIKPSTAVRRSLGRNAESLEGEERRRLEQLRRKLRGDLDNIVLKATQPEPDRRYGSAAELGEDLGRHLDKLPVRARPDTFLYRAGRFTRRHPKGVSAALLIFALLAMLGLQVQHTWAQRERARGMLDTLVMLFDSIDATTSAASSERATQILQGLELELGLGPDSTIDPHDRSLILNRMARMYRHYGFLPEARRAHERSLEIRRQLPNSSREDLVEGLNDLAAVLLGQEEYAEAETILREALEIDLPPDSEAWETRMAAWNNFAIILENEDDPAAAENLKRELLAENRELHGEESEDYAIALNNLTKLLLARGRYKEAEPLLHESVELRRRLWGADHLKTATSLHNLAFVHDALGEHEEAIRASSEVLRIRAQYFSADNSIMADAFTMQGFVLLGRGEPADLESAERLLREALPIFRAAKPEGESRLNAQRHLAAVRLARGDAAEAERLLEEVIEIRSQKEKDWRLADAQSLLGAALVAQGRLEEAEPLIRESYPIIRDATIEESRYAREARERLENLERLLANRSSGA